MVRKHWYRPWGKPPRVILSGSHRYADGTIHQNIESIGGKLTHLDKKWHYAAGIAHPNAKMPQKGLSLVPSRSALWFNAVGERILAPLPLSGYTDTRYLVESICKQSGQYSWQVMNKKIALKELAVSGSEYMKTFADKNKVKLVTEILFGNSALVRRLLQESQDFVIADSLDD